MRLSIMLSLALTMIVSGAEPTAAQIQENSDETPPRYQLDIIVTTAFRETEKFFSTIEEMSAEELHQHNVTTVAQALDLLPGLRTGVARVGHGEYVCLRGFEQQHLLVLVDGVPLYNPYDGLLELDQLPVEQIETIRVVKGPSSAQYGPNALGGVIHIVTRNSLSHLRQEADIQVGDNGAFGLRLSSGWHVGHWWLHLSGSRNQSDGFRLSENFRESPVPNLPSGQGVLSYEDGGWRDNSDYDKDAAHLNLTYLPNERFRLDLSGGLVDNQWGIPTHPIYNPAKKKSMIRYWRFQEWQQGMANLTVSARLKEHLWAQGGCFYNTYDNTLDGYDDDTYGTQEMPYAFHSIYDDHATGGHFHVNAFLGPVGTASFGAGLIQDVHRDTPDRGEPTVRFENRTWWFALEDLIRLTDRISATVGLNYSRLEKRKAAGLTEVGDDLGAANPHASLAGLISPSLRIYLSWSRSSCFPTMKQLYGQDGNPLLDVQRSHHIELGGEWSSDSIVQLRGSAFYDRIRDLIEGNYTSPSMLNIRRATLMGGELTVRIKPCSSIETSGSYSLLRARNESPERPGDHLQYRPSHQLDWSLMARLPRSITICFYGSALSTRFFYDDFRESRLSRLPAHAVGHLMIRKRWFFGLEPFMAINNILDTSCQHVYTSPAPGREIRGGLEMSW